MQQVRLIRVTGEPLRALQELEHYLQTTRRQDHSADVIDLTDDENELKPLKAKVRDIPMRDPFLMMTLVIGPAP